MRKRPAIVAFLVLAAAGVGAVAFAAQSEEAPVVGQVDEPAAVSPGQAKHAAAVVAETGASPTEVAGLRASGAGWGLIRHGYVLAEAEGIGVEEAIERIRNGEVEGKPPWAGPKQGDGIAPGQARKAAEVAAIAGVLPETVAEARAAGTGWGQLKKAAELVASDGLSFEEAVAAVRSAGP